ncbi:uncharacterized protein B0P05DRAFT_554750 [Gilbertella persicaria]|uniref:uncharacterized protein n=1 Tax=Gilbertella persicaria TaxID=101096 RepID=UPI002220E84B|nr:uncharacterized protein B0P05DRAFT_554750 [Gilbertella persicaria]KAI8064262.1 hypothetical protein B0P05DRAFT_554750 [Gilbertella persicaria]
MNISALNTPATPPYEYNQTMSDNTSNNKNLFFDRQASPSSTNDETVVSHSAFRRVSPTTMPSPPELLIDTSEDEEDSMIISPPTLFNTSSLRKRKLVPHRSPSTMDRKSIVFQLDDGCTPKILGGGGQPGILWSLRQRVSMARHQRRKNRLSAPRPERRARPMQIEIPRPQWFRDNTIYDDLVLPRHHDWQSKNSNVVDVEPTAVPVLSTIIAEQPWDKPVNKKPHTPRRKNSQHASSGRPSRVKGPCQACHETSDGCMRKAFNWPFPTSTIFNDKGKPFVYLCNKCGLRYNKSGGCVCRHCRWVLCKEEKRKAMQLIDQMRRSRPDGRIDPDENIENFVCTPKYWNCGCPWKVGWVLHSQHDAEDEEMMMDHHSPSLSEATL